MFTGIIEAVAKVTKVVLSGSMLRLELKSPKEFADIGDGSSVCINGVCLTVLKKTTGRDGDLFEFDVAKETAEKTNFKKLKSGSSVNMERALTLSSRLDGHLVLGHVDGTVTVKSIDKRSGSEWCFAFEYDKKMKGSFVEKGSVALNGISLTLFGLTEDTFKVAVLPFTFEHTNLKDAKTNDLINCEGDVIGKYVQLFMNRGNKESKMDLDFLRKHGFMGKDGYAD